MVAIVLGAMCLGRLVLCKEARRELEEALLQGQMQLRKTKCILCKLSNCRQTKDSSKE